MPSITLTDRLVAGLRADAAKRKEFPDKVARGLALRVSATAKSWHYRYMRHGAATRLVIGSYPAITLGEARARAHEARNALESGTDPRGLFEAQAGGGMTVADLVGSYLEKHAANLRSAAEIQRRFERNVLPVIGRTRLADLHKRDVNRVVDPILKRGAPTEASRAFEDVRALIRWGVQRGDLDHSVVEGMKKPHVGTPRERTLSDDEIAILWAGMPRALARSRTVQRIIRLLLVTGQRVGEVAGMRRDELDLSARLWRLPGARTKNAHPHTVPLSGLAIGIVREALAESDESPFVFPSGDGPVPPMAVAKTLARAQQADAENPKGRLGVQGFSAHDLRRTALTGMARLGVPPMTLGHIANHRTTTKAGVTFGVYIQHTFDSEKRAALDLWADRLRAIVEGGAAKVVPMKKGRG